MGVIVAILVLNIVFFIFFSVLNGLTGGMQQPAAKEEMESYESSDDEEEDQNQPLISAAKETFSSGVLVTDDEDDNEPIHKLLEPYSKDQLFAILRDAAETNPNLAARIRQMADASPALRTIFVYRLGPYITVEALQLAFARYGEIIECKIIKDKASGKSKGYGFVLFMWRNGARKALEQPVKKIGDCMTSCHLASLRPLVPASATPSSSSAHRRGPDSISEREIQVTFTCSEKKKGDIHR